MSHKILVIDDEKLIRWTLEQHLVKEGYEVVTADSAEKGLVLVNEEAPDLILLDNRLPEMTGGVSARCFTSPLASLVLAILLCTRSVMRMSCSGGR